MTERDDTKAFQLRMPVRTHRAVQLAALRLSHEEGQIVSMNTAIIRALDAAYKIPGDTAVAMSDSIAAKKTRGRRK